ncbi:MAG: adenylosuccinate lyase [Bacteroidales bacterium]|jgi:adenylosuccinate lyase|nr:adenylosuccinate lyase [Bacteroidales bacterium]
MLTALTAVSPIDGRYCSQITPLAAFLSEQALIRYRVLVEIEYFIALTELPLPQLKSFPESAKPQLRKLYEEFSEQDAQAIKDFEKVTNHDVKAVEYFIKKAFDALGLSVFKEFVHFGLTSQDINNTAQPMMFRDALQVVIFPTLNSLLLDVETKVHHWKHIPMLAKTHGQPASPTVLGKEIYVFVERLKKQIELFKTIPYAAKFGGATGNFNAHHVAYPDIDWVKFANHFVNDVLELHRSQTTTQVEHYDHIAAMFDNLKRINTILLDFSRDMWTYISMDYFKQRIKEGEIGSSAMPHKVNPIDFENAEGNIGIANALFEHLAAKLPVSRLQRDLTDSTVFRNMGVPLAHTQIAFNSLRKGIGKLLLNEAALQRDLDQNWAVVAEAIQTVLRREAYPNPYEALKELTRTNEKINADSIAKFIETLDVSEAIKAELRLISPSSYTGIFKQNI